MLLKASNVSMTTLRVIIENPWVCYYNLNPVQTKNRPPNFIFILKEF